MSSRHRSLYPHRFVLPLLPLALLPALLLSISCGSDATGVLPDGGPGGSTSLVLRLEKLSGDGQATQVGTVVPLPLVVRVTDNQGRPIRDARVDWSVKAGGGRIATTSVMSNATGEARLDSWVLGSLAGSNQLAASVSATGPVLFTAVGNPGPPVEVRLAPDSVTLWVGESTQLRATVRDEWGNAYLGQGAWVSDAPAIVAVSATGLVSGLRKGVGHVSATIGGIVASIRVTVLSDDETRQVATNGDGQNGTVGDPLPQELNVRVTDGTGSPVSGAEVHWWVTLGGGSITPASGVTDEEGVARAAWTLGIRPGANGASVSVEGAGTWEFGASAAPGPVTAVRVTPSLATIRSGEDVRFTAVPEDRFGNPRSDISVSWSTANAAIATVSEDGTAHGEVVGSVQIRALVASVVGIATLQVLAGGEAPNPGTVGDLRALSATSTSVTLRWTQVEDGTGAPANYALRYGSPTIDWASAEPTTVYVTGTGVGASLDFVRSGLAPNQTYQFQLVSLREAQGGVVYGALSNVVTVTTLSAGGGTPQVTNVTASPPTVSLAALGATAQLTAMARDAFGNIMGGITFAWQTLDPSVASVSGSGLVTAQAVGTARIVVRALCCAAADTVVVSVSQVPDRVLVSPSTVSLSVGEGHNLVGSVLDRNGHPVPGVTVVWSSFAPSIATVSSTGRVTGVAAGTTQVRAASGGLSGVATITVTAGSSTPITNPGTVGDLRVVGMSSGSATLAWTEVNNGAGVPARYDVRYADTPLGWGWGQATVVTQGSCATPVQGQGVGQTLTCTVEGLSSSHSYDFQLVAYRGEFGGTIAFGGLSNIVTGVTSGSGSTSLARISGDGQSGVVGSPLSQPIRVRAVSGAGAPMAGQTVTWSILAGGGSLSPSSTTTDAQGYAQVTWTLGTQAGAASAAATLSGAGTVAFGATAQPGSVVSVGLSPSSATIPVGGSQLITASGADRYGNAVGGLVLIWSSSAPTVATVTGGGVAAGVSAGSAIVTARTGSGISGTASLTVTPSSGGGSLAAECSAPSPAWIWCDDFESDRLGSYFEADNVGGRFTRQAGTGLNGSVGMQGTYTVGTSNAGNLKLAFGAVPDPYFSPVDGGVLKYRDIYWRMFVRTQAGWTGGGADKLSRALVFASGNWAAAAIGHIWSAGGTAANLAMEPVRGTDAAGTLLTTGYNDTAHFTWLGGAQGTTQLFSSANANSWHCVEAHMRLNDAGLANGILEFWVNGAPQASRSNLNFLGAFDAYGINAVLFENYWNSGPPSTLSRFWDNLVVSTEPIGCSGGTPGGAPPVAVVTISGGTSVAPGATLALTATQKDRMNATVTGGVSWASSNPGVATVDASSGFVRGVTVGTTTITATSSNGKSGSILLTVGGSGSTPVATVTLSPATASVQVGATQQLAATLRDASGNVLSGRTVSWSSSSSSVASVNSSGLVTGNAAGGPVTITASSEGRSGTASVTVTSPIPLPVASVTASPGSASLNALGASTQLSAIARDALGAALSGAIFNWRSLNTSIATVSSTGNVTARAVGTALIVVSATCCTPADTVPVTVTQVPHHVTVVPSSTYLQPGQSQTLSAFLRDANDSTIVGASLSWSSANSSVAAVDAAGRVTGMGLGTTQIRATSGSLTGTATATVSQSGGAAPAYEMDWPFANMTQLRAHRDYSDSGTADDNMSVLQGLSTPWGGTTAVRRPVTGGYNSVGINWDWPPIGQARAREVWIEIWQRFSPSWHVVSVPLQTTDDKTYFWLPNTNVRWELKFINSDVRAYVNNSPVPGGASVQIPGGESNLHDGKWHRVRLHLRMGTSGAYEIWYDDQKILSATGFNTGNGSSDYFAWCALGRNGGFQASATMDFGKMSLWTSNPGW